MHRTAHSVAWNTLQFDGEDEQQQGYLYDQDDISLRQTREQSVDTYRNDDQSTDGNMHTFTSFSSRFNRFSDDIYQEEKKSEKHRVIAVVVILAVSLALILLLFTGTTGEPPPVNDNSKPTPSPDPNPVGPSDPALDALRPQVCTGAFGLIK